MKQEKTKTLDEAMDKADKAAHNNEVKDKLWDAIECKEIASTLLKENTFVFPKNTPILYVFIDKSKTYWGKCSKCSDLMKFASGYEFTITINHEAWSHMDDNQRKALVHHEMLHIGYDSENDKYSLIKHDVEEFSQIVKKYGLWRDSVKDFADSAFIAINGNVGVDKG